MLLLKEQHHTTQTSINFAVKAIKGIINSATDSMMESVMSQLQQQNIPIPADIDNCFKLDLFNQLDTEYQQTKFYKHHFGLVACLIKFCDPMHSMILGYSML